MMTPEQKRLARHALGLPNDSRTSYRNRFAASTGGFDEMEWDGMVALGWAERGEALSYGRFYHLTRDGAELALAGREKLDREDFPVAEAV